MDGIRLRVLKCLSKYISILLIATMILQISPITVLAMDVQKGSFAPDIATDNKPTEAQIIGELENKREKNVKHFLKEDNTYEAILYPLPVHYQENGQWKEIDNSMVETTNEKNEKVLVNKQNNYKVQTAKQAKSDQLITIQKDQYEVSWKLKNPKSSLGQVQAKDSKVLSSLTENEKRRPSQS